MVNLNERMVPDQNIEPETSWLPVSHASDLATGSGLLNKFWIKTLPGGCIWNLIEIGPAVSEKSFEYVNKHSILVTFGQDHWLTLAFGIHKGA